MPGLEKGGKMNQITFDAKRIAEGYLNRPWLHKKGMEQFVKDCKITSNFQNGLDVGLSLIHISEPTRPY